VAVPAQSILFLGYGRAETRLIAFLETEGCAVDQTGDKVTADQVSRYDLVLSFGCRHILKPDVLAAVRRPIINLHIALLPWNRGAHPNFWAFHDGTPHGVTLHHMDEGVDTGDIVAQRQVTFSDPTLTFRQSQTRLLAEIEDLFMETWSYIRDMSYEAKPQTGAGTLHKVRDLPDFAGGWDCRICDALQEIKGTYK